MIQVQPNKFGFGPAFGYGEWRKEQEEKEAEHMHDHECSNCGLVFVQPIAKHQFCSHVTWVGGCCHQGFASEDDNYCVAHAHLYS